MKKVIPIFVVSVFCAISAPSVFAKDAPATSPLANSKSAKAESSGHHFSKYKTAGALWKHYETIDNERPAHQPTSRNELNQMLVRHLKSLDSVGDAFLACYPKNPHRWQIRLGRLQTAHLRRALGVEGAYSDARISAGFRQLLAAPDASKNVKSEASANLLMLSARSVKDAASFKAWNAKVESHLAHYPNYSKNESLKLMQAQAAIEYHQPEGYAILKDLAKSRNPRIAQLAKKELKKHDARGK